MYISDHSPKPRIDISYYEISGPDICSLICGYELRFVFKYNFSSKKIAAYLHYSPRISTRLARYSKLTKVILSFVFLSKKMNKKFYSKSIFDCQ